MEVGQFGQPKRRVALFEPFCTLFSGTQSLPNNRSHDFFKMPWTNHPMKSAEALVSGAVDMRQILSAAGPQCDSEAPGVNTVQPSGVPAGCGYSWVEVRRNDGICSGSTPDDKP